MRKPQLIKYWIIFLLFLSSVDTYAIESPSLTLRKNGEIIKVLTSIEILQIKDGGVSVTVDNPTDSKIHTYEGIALRVLLDQVFGNTWKGFDLVKFITSDGYQPVIPVKSIVTGFGVISTGEKGYSGFQKLLRRNGETVDPGPFYLVWENIKGRGEDPWLSWPWQITTIELTSLSREFPHSAPPTLSGEVAKDGFLAFRQHCIKCHSINGDGGNVGPELNYPVSVTEYWKEEWLARFITDPQSIRANSKMIPFYRDVKNRQEVISAIIAYLKVMKGKKTN